jgi:hypothetical protein
MFGLLEYRNSFNLGDNIQSLAAQNFLGRVDALVDRDTSEITTLRPDSMIVNVIYNGWFDGSYTKFPLPPNIRALFVSFHVNETDHTTDKSYAFLEKHKLKQFTSMLSHREFFRDFEPVGARDPHTLRKLQDAGVKSYFSGCLTLTLPNKFTTRNSEILIVDVSAKNLLLIPQEKRDRAVYVSHLIRKQLPHAEKMKLAQDLLNRYAQCAEVYTSRLHCLLPCKAFGTRVVFLPNDPDDARFVGLCDLSDEQVRSLAADLRVRVEQWMVNVVCDQSKTVSIVTACMNRFESLSQSFVSWVALRPMEIILVDWGSSNSAEISKLVASHASSQKIIFIRVENVKKWTITQALNFATRFSSGEHVLKVDCDTMLHPHFLRYHNMDCGERVFFAGNWKIARNKNESHTNGVCFVNRADFFKVGGFDEYLVTYGYDDCKLYSDLVNSGCSRADLCMDFVSHIPHDNASRVKHQDVTHALDVEIECNRLISMATRKDARGVETPAWPNDFAQFEWESNNVFRFVSACALDPAIRKDCITRAIRNRAPFKKHLYINVQNGIGNRLRALASAFNIAEASNRQLILVWIPDFHCMARFEDLFESVPEIMVTEKLPKLRAKCEVFEAEHAQQSLHTQDKYDYIVHKDQYIEDESENDIYISSACVLNNKHTSWSKQCKFLQSLVVHPDIKLKIEEFAASHVLRDVIGVHIRMSQPSCKADDVSKYHVNVKSAIDKWRTASHWRVFLAEMTSIVDKHPHQQFLLCCDNEEALRGILGYFGTRHIIVYPNHMYDRSVDQIKLALTEVVLLSQTCRILGSNWSTFTELARRLGNAKTLLAGVDF